MESGIKRATSGHTIGIDASDRGASVCLWTDDREFVRECDQGAAEHLPALLGELVEEAGCGWADIALCACSIGPGSHTGIRVAIAMAQGLSIAAGIPLIGVTRFEQLAAAAAMPGGEVFAVVCGIGRGKLALQPFEEAGRASGEAAVLDGDDRAALCRVPVLVVDAAVAGGIEVGPAVRVVDSQVHARYVASAGWQKIESGEEPVLQGGLKPLYLQPVDARQGAGAPLVQVGKRA